MASSSASNSTASTEITVSQVKKSTDVGWEFGILLIPNNFDKVKCKLCGKEFSGGVYRLKQHVARVKGNVSACPRSTPEQQEKCKKAIQEVQNKRKRIRMKELEVSGSVNIDDQGEKEEIEIEGMEKNKLPRMLGPMDRYTSKINPESPLSVGTTWKQQDIQNVLAKERLKAVHQYVARWVYTRGVPFNMIVNNEFRMMLEAAGQFGPGVTPPSMYQLREPLLKGEVDRMKDLMKEQEEEWKLTGCSIMTDAWSDRKRRSIMNLCINCRKGTMFLSSKDCSSEAHTGQYIFEHVKECIENVGEENVVQVVMDNATNNMAASKLLKEVKPRIFWTSCATHTINLMVESIAKLPKFEKTIEMAKAFTICIYAHHKTLSMMRSFTRRRDIVRPGVTRFASAFLTLQSLMEKKENLKAMFASNQWEESKWYKHSKGKAAYNTVMSISFWNGVTTCLKVFAHLVRVLRLVDGDRKPTMEFLYGELVEAKKEIREACGSLERNYESILSIIDQRIKGRLDSPLHLTAYLLNPYYAYKDPTIQLDDDVLEATFKCADTFFPNDLDVQSFVVNVELVKYKRKEEKFGLGIAMKGCEKNDETYDPVEWWQTYGNGVRQLQKIATRILALTTSSSGCERNWSTFEGVHTKKRNRLDTKRLNNLVYVQFNARLLAKKRQRDKDLDILLGDDAYHAQDWIVEDIHVDVDSREDGLLVVREVDESDFESEEEEDVNIEFESDNEQVVEEFGQLQLDLNI